AAIGYAASNLNSEIENYANVAQVTLKAIVAYAEDVRAGRHLKGQRPAGGRHRRHQDALRGDRRRAASADVCARWLRCDGGEMEHARRLRPDQAARAPAGK